MFYVLWMLAADKSYVKEYDDGDDDDDDDDDECTK